MKGERWMDKHHRLPKSRGGSNSMTNILYVRKDKHTAYHLLVGNALPEEVARIVSEFIDPRFKLVVVPRAISLRQDDGN